MDLKLNDAPLFNVLLVLNSTHVHAMSSSNTKPFKSELFVNSNVLVLLKPIHKHTFNNTVLNSLMLAHFFNKLALLVLSKIFHHQLVQHLLVSVQAHTVKKLHSVHHQDSKVVPDSLLEVVPDLLLEVVPDLLLVWMLAMVVAVHHHTNHQASHLVSVVDMVLQVQLMNSLLLIPTAMVALIKVNSATLSVNNLVVVVVLLAVVHPHMNHHSAHQLAIKQRNEQSKINHLKISCYMQTISAFGKI
jgi:hypothetical protein